MATDRPLVYVSGMITDGGRLPFADAEERFRIGCLEVAQLGYTPVSPLEICADLGRASTHDTWPQYMRANIRALMSCSGIYMLVGWENSRGARLEKLIADGLDMFCLFQSEGERDGESRSRN